MNKNVSGRIVSSRTDGPLEHGGAVVSPLASGARGLGLSSLCEKVSRSEHAPLALRHGC